MSSALNNYLTASFYRFVTISDCEALSDSIRRTCQANQLTGTVLVACEGINGSVCGKPDNVHSLLTMLRRDERFKDLEHKESFSEAPTLKRLKVKVKAEIITMRNPGVDAANCAGQYVEPEDWNALISDSDVVVIDTRNDYEVAIGTFRNSIDPKTRQFSDLSAWVDKQDVLKDKPRVAMFCTGGIRCEKSTALLRAKGFDDVYHLRGGILKYLEKIPPQNSLFDGECFVFDERVSVDHHLRQGHYLMCYGCGRPIDKNDANAENYVRAQSCPNCAEKSEANTNYQQE